MDLKKLKENINQRKSEMKEQSIALGETQVAAHASSDGILHELLQAHNTGQPTKAIEKIKAVNELADSKGGVGTVPSGGGLSDAVSQFGGNSTPTPNPMTPKEPVKMMNEREKLFEQKLTSGQQSLSTSLNNYGMPQHVNPAGMNTQLGMVNPAAPVQINEQQIIQTVNNALNENVATMVQEVMKSTIIEMYEADKLKNAIIENKDMIQKIVRETIIELSKKNKKTSS